MAGFSGRCLRCTPVIWMQRVGRGNYEISQQLRSFLPFSSSRPQALSRSIGAPLPVAGMRPDRCRRYQGDSDQEGGDTYGLFREVTAAPASSQPRWWKPCPSVTLALLLWRDVRETETEVDDSAHDVAYGIMRNSEAASVRCPKYKTEENKL